MDFVVDGNAYLNVAISVAKSIAHKDKAIGSQYYVEDIFNDGNYILRESIKVQFRNFCLNYFHSLIAPVGNKISRVHLVFDSKSWRRDFIKKYFDQDNFDSNIAPSEFVYKGNRKKDDMIHLFFDYFQNEIVPHLIVEAGINYYRIKGTEGDDIIAYLCEELKTDILIYTVDGDIKQLTYSPKKNIVVIYPKQMSKHKKICVPEEFNPSFAEEEDDNFFSLNESHVSKPAIFKIISIFKDKDYVEYEVDPIFEIFSKIFRGDKKDNIPKMDKMTPIKSNKMIELIKDEFGKDSINLLDKLDETFINFVVKNISILNKVNDINKLKDIRKHFLFNVRIIRLSSNLFPQVVQDSLNEGINIEEFNKFNFKKFTHLKNNPSLI